jgi:hypothetical protein
VFPDIPLTAEAAENAERKGKGKDKDNGKDREIAPQRAQRTQRE